MQSEQYWTLYGIPYSNQVQNQWIRVKSKLIERVYADTVLGKVYTHIYKEFGEYYIRQIDLIIYKLVTRDIHLIDLITLKQFIHHQLVYADIYVSGIGMYVSSLYDEWLDIYNNM